MIVPVPDKKLLAFARRIQKLQRLGYIVLGETENNLLSECLRDYEKFRTQEIGDISEIDFVRIQNFPDASIRAVFASPHAEGEVFSVRLPFTLGG